MFMISFEIAIFKNSLFFEDVSMMIRKSLKLAIFTYCVSIAIFINVANATSSSKTTTTESRYVIDEKSFISIGGIEQWITITGTNRSNPIILFLHGGPGDAQSPYADSMYGSSWQLKFTLVQWDQRGAGRTYGKSGEAIASTLTIDRMVNDGIEVAEYLTKHLHQKKIILTGGSWGSVLGIYMVKKRPDLFYAYVGTAQVVKSKQAHEISYARLLELAHAAGDEKAVGELESIGAPPWDGLRKLVTYLRLTQIYEAKTAPPLKIELAAGYAGEQDRKDYAAADELSFITFFGFTAAGPMMQIDLPTLGTDFAIPVFFIQGQHDLRAPPEIARAYFDSIKAPQKEFFLLTDSAHDPSRASIDKLWDVLLKKVRPLTMSN
jgi:pimeloyl-ACP methyl ester carboxylesterase